MLPEDTISAISEAQTAFSNLSSDIAILADNEVHPSITIDSLDYIINKAATDRVKEALVLFRTKLESLPTATVVSGYEGVFNTLKLEKQLLAEIRALDLNNEFYYCVPVEDRLAIELNESDKKLNTLANPLTNYDINNVNNCFVI